VHAFDARGHPVSGDECEVTIAPDAGGEEADVDIVDNGDGTYAVAYQAEEFGVHTLNVTLDGAAVKEMPMKLTVRESADATQTSCQNGTFTFTFHAKNKKGLPKSCGGDAFACTVVGPGGHAVGVETTDHQDGQYSAKYTLDAPRAAGDVSKHTYVVSMTMAEEEIVGSPFEHNM
jgi:hypothetical protein